MSNKFDEYKREREEKERIIDSMKSDMIIINVQIEKIERITERQEKYVAIACYARYHRK